MGQNIIGIAQLTALVVFSLTLVEPANLFLGMSVFKGHLWQNIGVLSNQMRVVNRVASWLTAISPQVTNDREDRSKKKYSIIAELYFTGE